MEENAANNLTFFLSFEGGKDELGTIRHWNNLKVAFEERLTWVKDLNYTQANSVEIKCIPCRKLYQERSGKLFPVNSRLPEREVPAILWTPIDRALSIERPSFNHNFFGIQEQISIKLLPSAIEQNAAAMIAGLSDIATYLETAPAIRLSTIKWAVLNSDQGILVGTPLLPINGNAMWLRSNSLIPAGYDMELHCLTETLEQLLNPEGDSLIIWNEDGTWFPIAKEDLQPLSRSSLRLTIEKLTT